MRQLFDMAGVNILDYRWAAVGASRAAWRKYGRRIDQEDAEQAGLLALADCPRTFDASRYSGWESPRCRGMFGIYVKQAAWNAVKRLCLKERHHASKPLEEERQESEAPAADDRAMALRKWAGQDKEKLLFLQELAQEPENETSAQRAARKKRHEKLMPNLRAALGMERPKGRLLTSAEAAKLLRMADRRIRDYCERAVLPAYRNAGAWEVPLSEVARFRRERIVKALESGASYRQAQEAGRCSIRIVHKAACKARHERRRGRPAKHDHELVLAMLSDPVSFPQAWKDGRPVISAVARMAGCPRRQVQRLANRAIRCDARQVQPRC